jgi:hypothetical protein
MNILSSTGIFVALAGICLDRLLMQRSALQKPDLPFALPPPRGGLRSLSVGADYIATESRALSELLSQARQTPSDRARTWSRPPGRPIRSALNELAPNEQAPNGPAPPDAIPSGPVRIFAVRLAAHAPAAADGSGLPAPDYRIPAAR